LSQSSRKFWILALTALAVTGLLSGMLVPINRIYKVQAGTQKGSMNPSYEKGPFSDQPETPTVFSGDLRDLPQLPSMRGELPTPGSIRQPIQLNSKNSSAWVDPVAQQSLAKGQMPTPMMNFEGLMKSDGGGYTPPDTNGDVGPIYYIQTVNIALGIYDKASGTPIVKLTYNDFFQGPPGSSCDNNNRADVILIYDPRWTVGWLPIFLIQVRTTWLKLPPLKHRFGGWYSFYPRNPIPPYQSIACIKPISPIAL
jgi:hypothetical protein